MGTLLRGEADRGRGRGAWTVTGDSACRVREAVAEGGLEEEVTMTVGRLGQGDGGGGEGGWRGDDAARGGRGPGGTTPRKSQIKIASPQLIIWWPSDEKEAALISPECPMNT